MKVKPLILSLLLGAGLSLFFACKKDDPAAGLRHYTKGVFVVNQGPFSGTGTVTWYNPGTGETVQDVFGAANNGAALGEFAQSLTLHQGKGYIVVNGANKVYVVDGETLQFLDSIPGLQLPRYVLPLDNQFALISQWGANGLNGSVAKVDLLTNQVVRTIPTGNGPEKMIRQADGLVVVPNSGGFGVDSTVSVLNFGNTAELSRLTVPGKNPSTAALAGFLNGPFGSPTFVYCAGSYLDPAPAGWVGPTGTAFGSGSPAPPFGYDLVASPDGQTLYLAAGGKVYAIDAAGMRVLFDQPALGLACDPTTGYLYCADAKDFNSAGEVVIYKPTGEKVGAFTAGVAPGQIIFIP